MSAMPLLIKETPPESPHIKHDQLYKELISTFFQEFLDVFFSEVHKHINFQRITLLSEDVLTKLLYGDARRLDIVIETSFKDTDIMIIVHIEPQSYRQTDLNERMYHYFSLLYN